MPNDALVASDPPPNRQLVIEYVAPGRLQLNANNPKRHTRAKIAKLAKSLKALGMNTPILVDAGLQVLSGEARLRACLELGLKMVPIVRLEHLSPEEAQLFMLAENRFGELATMDQAAVGRLFKDLSVLNFDIDLDVSGFAVTEIDLMIEAVDLEVDGDNSAEAPPVAGPAIARLGDVWVLESSRRGVKHVIVVGDSLATSTLSTLMGGELAHAVITDPPFGGEISGYLTGQGKVSHREFVQGSAGGLSPAELEALLAKACANAAAHARPGALAYVFMDWRGLEVLLRVGRTSFAELKNIIVWSKGCGGMGALYRSQHELIALFKTAGGEHRNNVQLGVHGRNRTNVWSYPGMTSARGRFTEEGDLLALHPTVKPVQMIADAMLDCTARGDLVLDLFGGSGTTLIACERVGRAARLCELDPLYVDVALRRWRALTGDEPVRQDGHSLYDLELQAEAA